VLAAFDVAFPPAGCTRRTAGVRVLTFVSIAYRPMSASFVSNEPSYIASLAVAVRDLVEEVSG